MKKKAPKERASKRNKGQGPKSRQASSPNEAGHKEKREPLRTKPSNGQVHCKERHNTKAPQGGRPDPSKRK